MGKIGLINSFQNLFDYSELRVKNKALKSQSLKSLN